LGEKNMDYIREATEYLKSYSYLKGEEKELEEKIQEIEEELLNVKEIHYSDMPTGSNRNRPDDELVNTIFRLDKCKNKLDSMREDMKKIVLSLNKLPPYERDVLTYYYIDGIRDFSLYEKLRCSERKFYSDKAKIIRKFAIQLFGIEVIY
jgi:DNA-directed RNA polymerase specialized sigma24 family protein